MLVSSISRDKAIVYNAKCKCQFFFRDDAFLNILFGKNNIPGKLLMNFCKFVSNHDIRRIEQNLFLSALFVSTRMGIEMMIFGLR